MTDRPIPFSGPMVRALLEGRKTQTRRVLNRARVFATPESPAFTLTGEDMHRALQNADRFRRIEGDGWFWESDAFPWQAPAERTGWMAHIGYAPGDRLWVREALRKQSTDQGVEYGAYDADNQKPWWAGAGWHFKRNFVPPMHMRREYSRLTLHVTEVRVQRVQEISTRDVLAEGLVLPPVAIADAMQGADGDREQRDAYHRVHVDAYRDLWDSLNAKRGYGWEANPWVVAISFTVHHGNIDAVDTTNPDTTNGETS